MRKMAFVANLLALVITFSYIAYSPRVGAIQPQKLAFNYHPASNTFTLHEPVIFNVVINNILSTPISVDLGPNRKENFLFTITRPDGIKIQVPRIIKDGLSTSGKISLMPEGAHNQRLVLNEWFDFSNLGKYLIEVRMDGVVKTQQGTVVKPDTSYQTAIEIKPCDAEKLARVCDGLLQEVIAAPTYARAIEPAVALSYVSDSVAVPYLEKMLRANRRLDGVALFGLSRINDSQAVEALLSALNMKDKDTSIMAHQRLYRIQDNIKDPNLKKRVEQALKR